MINMIHDKFQHDNVFCFSFKKDQTGFLADFFEVLAGPPELFADVDSDDSESDDDDVWSDEDMDNDNLVSLVC